MEINSLKMVQKAAFILAARETGWLKINPHGPGLPKNETSVFSLNFKLQKYFNVIISFIKSRSQFEKNQKDKLFKIPIFYFEILLRGLQQIA